MIFHLHVIMGMLR